MTPCCPFVDSTKSMCIDDSVRIMLWQSYNNEKIAIEKVTKGYAACRKKCLLKDVSNSIS